MSIAHAQLVEQCYRAFLGRAPEAGAVQSWVAKLEAGMEVAVLLQGFMASEEYRQRAAAGMGLFVPPGHFYSPLVDPAQAASLFEPGRQRLEPAAIDIDADLQLVNWNRLLPHLQSQPFGEQPKPGLRYFFNNPAFGHADGCVLHAMLRTIRPRRLIEVGSGYSSACAIDTIDAFLDGQVEVTFIEPYPRLLEELVGAHRLAVCTVIPQGVQAVDPALFESLQAGDILFIDSTHVMKTGSDVCQELFEILPRLAPGVVVHFHDVFWPFEYPAQWVLEERRAWNELYGIRAFLMYNSAFRVEFFNDYFFKNFRPHIEAGCPVMLAHPGASLWLSKRS